MKFEKNSAKRIILRFNGMKEEFLSNELYFNNIINSCYQLIPEPESGDPEAGEPEPDRL